MHAIDQRDFVLRNDPKEMYRLTCEFPAQCRQALSIARAAAVPAPSSVSNIVLIGMGGSAVGGDFVRALLECQGSIPFQVCRDYHVPGYVGASTLVLASSYSGNTEETLSAYAEARSRGAQVIVLTTGGKLGPLAQEHGVPWVKIPSGQPPRTALGFLCIPVIALMEQFGFIPTQDFEAAFALLDQCVADWGIEVPFLNNPSKQLAQVLYGKVSVLYGLGTWQGIVANRWKGQINENAKNMTFANSFPELNHNEILGWVKANGQGVNEWVSVVLEDGSESAKMKARASITLGLVKDICPTQHRVVARGSSLLEKMLSLVLNGDFVSLYLAALNDVDPENIDWINVLKTQLSVIE